MDARIILAGQQPDFLGTIDRANTAAARQNEFGRQNALAELYRNQGAQIAQGDAAALNALARFDPSASLGIQGQRQDMAIGARRMEIMNADEKRAAEQYARSLSAAEASAQAAQIEDAVKMGLAAQTPEQWDQVVGSIAPDLVGQFGNRQAIANKYMSMAEILKQARGPDNKDRYKTVGGQLIDLYAEGGPMPVSGIDGRNAGMNIQLPDGTVISNGGPLPGQNNITTGTPRNGAKLAGKLSENDAATLKEFSDASTTAAQLESLANQFDVVSPRVGYTGPGGSIYGTVDDIVKVFPGDEGARGAFRSISMDAQLSFTERTKGAITDREMGMFKSATPNLGQTQEGNKAIADVMRAGAARTQTRAAFFEAWARKYGSLEGAQSVWSQYMRDNPIIVEKNGSIAANPEGDFNSYLNRKPAMAYTPQSILTLSEQEILSAPIDSMTAPQLDALEARMKQLGIQ